MRAAMDLIEAKMNERKMFLMAVQEQAMQAE
jgi:hypothetical protein